MSYNKIYPEYDVDFGMGDESIVSYKTTIEREINGKIVCIPHRCNYNIKFYERFECVDMFHKSCYRILFLKETEEIILSMMNEKGWLNPPYYKNTEG